MTDSMCRHCGWRGTETECPRCRASMVNACEAVTGPPGPRAIVARLPNAAEAGYFADELSHLLDCEAVVEFSDDYDATGGNWRTQYTLSVPESVADQARTELRRLVDGDWGDEADRLAEPPRTVRSGVNWVPIMMTLAAGSFVIWCGKKMQPQVAVVEPGETLAVDLLDVLSTGDRTWVQRRPDGVGTRELHFDRAGKRATLREDTNGDGVFDRRRVITGLR